MAGRRALVTGATGFIGSRLCERLLELGAEVHGVSRRVRVAEGERVRWHCADLGDATAVQGLVRRVAPDTVFHLASEVSGKPGPELVQPTLRSNLMGTVNVLAAVQDAGCRRMVVTGSVTEAQNGEPATSPYAAAKRAATQYAEMFHSLYGTPVVCLRLAMVYGPGQTDSRKLIPHVIGSLRDGERPEVSNGKWEVDWVYLDDVVDALILAAVTDGVEGRTLDVGSGEVASVRQVVEQLTRIVDPEQKPRFGALTTGRSSVRSARTWSPPARC